MMKFVSNTRNCVSKPRNLVSKTKNLVFKMVNCAGAGGRVVIMEDQNEGQRIKHYTLEGRTQSGWVEVIAAQSIGHKRIVVLPNTTAVATAFRLTVVAVAGDPSAGASLRSFAAFGAKKCAVPPTPPHEPCSLEENYAFAGNVLTTNPSSKDVSACCTACRAVAAKACVAFSQTPAGVCTLFKALGGGSKAAGTVRHTSTVGHMYSFCGCL